MVNTYKLVNPYIKGDFETKISSKNSLEAAKKFYGSLSEHFNNNVPKFYFTIQKGGTKSFSHFEVSESRSNDEVDYSIRPYTIKGEEGAMNGFLKSFEGFKGRYNGRKGSKKNRSSSKKGSKRNSNKRTRSKNLYESIEDEQDFMEVSKSYIPTTTQPIYYWYYDPLVYKLNSVYIPTFYAYVTPYVEINSGGLDWYVV
jgi:hypothetical protein